ncbi:hypothetical protein PG993_001147 [Apiospora rasikravindrae]|uniref:Lysosomal cobalamin transporter n=1 Tax=Apiospora rasikravindrae TaxID=990691 RepID=A0ABR1UAM3_9PEZI
MASVLSAASPVGSEVFAAIALLVLSFVVLLILRYYLPLRATPAYVLVPIFFALWLPAFIVLLVPIDLASSAATDDVAARGIWFPPRLLLVSWRITYWLTFALTWFILPILAEYSDAGYREPRDRVMYSLRQNAQYQAIVLGSGILGLVYYFITYGFRLEFLKGVVMALAYCWGLFLAIYLMGHGLVTIPRTLFRNASISGRLRRLQSHAPKLYEKMEDAIMNLEELEVQVSELSKRKTGTARNFQEWIEDLADMCNVPESRPGSSMPRIGTESRILPTVITEKYMADLTRQLDRARHAKSRYVDEWNLLLLDASRTQAILDSAASKKLDFGSATPGSSFLERTTILNPYSRYVYHFHVLPALRVLFAGFLALASACIIWSEMVRTALPSLSVIRLSVVHHWTGEKGQVGFAGQVIAALWIMYMCAAALTSMTEVKVWRGRALVRRNTAYESGFWYASYVARLSVPLSYNFMTFLSPTVFMKTRFYKFLGKLIDFTPLGNWFDNLFPILVLIPVCATLFGLYGKVKRMVGFDMDLVDEEENETGYGTGSWREGRALIERELNGTSLSRREAIIGGSAARSSPILSVPAARREGAPTTPFATSPSSYRDNVAPPSSRTTAQSRSRIANSDGNAEDDSFFTSLGHRMKNTIDTIETPKWFQEIGDGIKKPKWLGGDEEGTQAGSSSAAGSGSGSNSNNLDVRRWFGGGNDGRIRL